MHIITKVIEELGSSILAKEIDIGQQQETINNIKKQIESIECYIDALESYTDADDMTA